MPGAAGGRTTGRLTALPMPDRESDQTAISRGRPVVYSPMTGAVARMPRSEARRVVRLKKNIAEPPNFLGGFTG